MATRKSAAPASENEQEPRRGRPRAAGRPYDILDTFARHVAARGYSDTNYSDIAADLGISKGTIVHYYATKDRLFAAMHDLYLRRCLSHARTIIEKLDDPAEQLAGVLISFVLYQDHDRDFTVAFQREMATLATHDSMADGRRLRADYLALVRDLMKAGARDGAFWSVDVDIHSLLIFGSSQWAWTWFEPEGRMSALDIGCELVKLVLGSLLVDRGRLAALTDPRGRAALVALECVTNSVGAPTPQ
ncbi:TetR/AcrR family transcriptional regulator [Antrihabitans stalactiti]|uniref:TetR/AcrR family transcriptional regulator n=1 Tax=Antrihabitans stalactiti TaxID=2584121 RepID=A0A848KKK1_9NOCA|nr:TetR/AcrR family transcriptional regulator [Antrihabitans stalactiti]NMN98398.1 TetR/AcrR family transcriptional regulator [Antrihabitans stalactiti]